MLKRVRLAESFKSVGDKSGMRIRITPGGIHGDMLFQFTVANTKIGSVI